MEIIDPQHLNTHSTFSSSPLLLSSPPHLPPSYPQAPYILIPHPLFPEKPPFLN